MFRALLTFVVGNAALVLLAFSQAALAEPCPGPPFGC